MFNLDIFIAVSVTFRTTSMFESDIKANAKTLTYEIKGQGGVRDWWGRKYRFFLYQGNPAV